MRRRGVQRVYPRKKGIRCRIKEISRASPVRAGRPRRMLLRCSGFLFCFRVTPAWDLCQGAAVSCFRGTLGIAHTYLRPRLKRKIPSNFCTTAIRLGSRHRLLSVSFFLAFRLSIFSHSPQRVLVADGKLRNVQLNERCFI